MSAFMERELEKFQRFLNPDDPEGLRGHWEDEEVLQGEDEEQRRRNKEALLNITVNFLRQMNQEDLAKRLHSSKSIFQPELYILIQILLISFTKMLNILYSWFLKMYRYCLIVFFELAKSCSPFLLLGSLTSFVLLSFDSMTYLLYHI